MQNISDADSLNQMVLQTAEDLPQKQRKELEILRRVFLGALYAQQVDSLNPKSTDLYEQAATMADATENSALQLWTDTNVGFYFYSYNQYPVALPYFFKSSRALNVLDDRDLLSASDVLKRNAYFFSTIKEYDRAIEYLQRALRLTSPETNDYGDLLNALGNCYLNKGAVEKAKYYFNETKKNGKDTDNQIRYAKALGDLALVEMNQKHWQEAEKLLLEDIVLSDSLGEYRNAMFARLRLGEMYLQKGDTVKAYQSLTESKQYAETKTYLKGYEKQTVKLLLQIIAKKNRPQEELLLRRKLDTLNILTAAEDAKTIDQLALNFEKEKIQWQLQAEQIKLEKAALVHQAGFAIIVLLLVVVGLLYLLYKRRLKLRTVAFEKKLLVFQHEKIQSEQKLSETHKSLASFQIFLEEKNHQIKLLEQEIEKKNTTEQKASLEELLSKHLMTNENWSLFKQAFIEERPEYYKSLQSHFPDLTESHLRIILLQKMGLNNTETAQILGVTIDAVKKAKQRLRKKYNAAQEDSGFELFSTE